MGGQERQILERAVLLVAKQAAKSEGLVDQAIAVAFVTLGLCIVLPRCRKHPFPKG